MTQETIGLPEISLGDLLTDAAAVLEQNELRALARGTRIAAAMLGGPCRGEAWISDIMVALDAADAVIHTAKANPEAVDLGALRDALDKVRNWGLDPQDRLGNAFQHVVRLAAMFIAAGELERAGRATDPVAVNAAFGAFVDALGFDSAGAPQESEA
jgi:hypothetical protein